MCNDTNIKRNGTGPGKAFGSKCQALGAGDLRDYISLLLLKPSDWKLTICRAHVVEYILRREL